MLTFAFFVFFCFIFKPYRPSKPTQNCFSFLHFLPKEDLVSPSFDKLMRLPGLEAWITKKPGMSEKPSRWDEVVTGATEIGSRQSQLQMTCQKSGKESKRDLVLKALLKELLGIFLSRLLKQILEELRVFCNICFYKTAKIRAAPHWWALLLRKDTWGMQELLLQEGELLGVCKKWHESTKWENKFSLDIQTPT